MTAPRVKYQISANRTCYLSNQPPFHLLLHVELVDSLEQFAFLEDGFADDTHDQYQPINSNLVLQCFDEETGEQVHVLRQGSSRLFSTINYGYVEFSSSDTRGPEELPFITSALRPDRNYRLSLNPVVPITHWPTSAFAALQSFQETAGSAALPCPSSTSISWQAAAGNRPIIFRTLSSQPRAPNISVTLSAPPMYSLSTPFAFTLIFTTDAVHPITVHADRAWVIGTYGDIEILHATTRAPLFPRLDVCRDDEDHSRQAFIRVDGSYAEHREIDLKQPLWHENQLEIGEEYILKHSGATWWWSEEAIEEVVAYLKSPSNLGLAYTEPIKFAGAEEVSFRVVE
jgi:hypothetical protein